MFVFVPGGTKIIGYFKDDKLYPDDGWKEIRVHGEIVRISPVAVLTNDPNLYGKGGYPIDSTTVHLSERKELNQMIKKWLRESALDKLSEKEKQALGIRG